MLLFLVLAENSSLFRFLCKLHALTLIAHSYALLFVLSWPQLLTHSLHSPVGISQVTFVQTNSAGYSPSSLSIWLVLSWYNLSDSQVLWGFLELLVIGNTTPHKHVRYVYDVVRLFASSY